MHKKLLHLDLAWAANGAAMVKGASRRCYCLAMRGVWCERQVAGGECREVACFGHNNQCKQQVNTGAAHPTPWRTQRENLHVHTERSSCIFRAFEPTASPLFWCIASSCAWRCFLDWLWLPKTTNGGLHLQGALGHDSRRAAGLARPASHPPAPLLFRTYAPLPIYHPRPSIPIARAQ